MCVARTARRRRRQIRQDKRYSNGIASISKKVGGKARLLAMREKSSKVGVGA